MKTARLGIIVFARMSSHRLPGKVLMDFAGRPLLAHILARAADVAQPVIVATSDQPEDAAVAALALACGATAFRGSLDDVLQRAVDAARFHKLDAFARLCGDRPYFLQNEMRDALQVMAASLATAAPWDLVSNLITGNPPPGLSTEVVRVAALERALANNADAHQREHLTRYLYDHAETFEICPLSTDFRDVRGRRFAVDTEEDYRLLGAAARRINDPRASHDLVASLLPTAVAAAISGAAHG